MVGWMCKCNLVSGTDLGVSQEITSEAENYFCAIFPTCSFFFSFIPVHGLYWSAAINEVTGFWNENPSYKVREQKSDKLGGL